VGRFSVLADRHEQLLLGTFRAFWLPFAYLRLPTSCDFGYFSTKSTAGCRLLFYGDLAADVSDLSPQLLLLRGPFDKGNSFLVQTAARWLLPVATCK
jgi:hypothetical protein